MAQKWNKGQVGREGKWRSSSTWVSRQMSPQTPSPPPATAPPPPPIGSSLLPLPLPSPPAQAQPLLPLFQRRRAAAGEPTSRKRTREVLPAPQRLSERMRPRTIDEGRRLPPPLLRRPPPLGPSRLRQGLPRPLPRRLFPPPPLPPLLPVSARVKDVRDAVDDARKSRRFGATVATVLFFDEVHHFNKAQQDSFLPSIEDGSIVFLGATTENPSFHIVTPLLSRCRVLKLNPLGPTDIAGLLRRPADDG